MRIQACGSNHRLHSTAEGEVTMNASEEQLLDALQRADHDMYVAWKFSEINSPTFHEINRIQKRIQALLKQQRTV
jgi:transcriptional regulator NrdR family protein